MIVGQDEQVCNDNVYLYEIVVLTLLHKFSGECNFTMSYTGLSVGRFMQLGVARGLFEYGPNIEKGLCQRFLWIIPKPSTTLFD